jgi:hypothetical protein
VASQTIYLVLGGGAVDGKGCLVPRVGAVDGKGCLVPGGGAVGRTSWLINDKIRATVARIRARFRNGGSTKLEERASEGVGMQVGD